METHPTDDAVSIRYRVSLQDYRRAIFAWYGPRFVIPLDIVVGVAIVGLGLLRPQWFGPDLATAIVVLGGAFLVFLPIALFIVPMWRVWREPKFRYEYEATFSPSGVRTLSEASKSEIAWNFFTRAIVTKDECLLLYTRRNFMTVPLRAFASDNDRQKFLALVAANISKVKRRAGAPPIP